MPELIEKRFADDCELRVDNEGKMLQGYAAVFNKRTDLYWFDEMVMPGAFREAIEEDDIRALIDHNSSLILGRNKAKTLRLVEDEKGLRAEIDPPDNINAKNIIESVRRKDVTGMSFAFMVKREEWVEPDKNSNKNSLRKLLEVGLRDVSIVTYPAYPQTSIKYRAEMRDVESIYKNRHANIGNNIQYYRRYFMAIENSRN